MHWLLKSLAWAAGLAVAGALAALALVAIGLMFAYPNLPAIDSLADYRPKQPLRVYAADGVLLAEFGEERRHFTRLHDFPPVLRQAVLAIEDARFYEHEGVDPIGLARAALANLTDAGSQGGSTITMQVARNFYLSSEKTITRKIYEILLALKIETHLTKDEILEVYMNQIFLGHRAHGFAAAARTYFGKPVAALTLAEAAMLAGLPQAPSAFNPFANLQRATARQRQVLDRMLDVGFIDAQQHAAALAEALRLRRPSETRVQAEHAAETARQMIYAKFGDETYARGLRVELTLDSREQAAAVRAVRQGLMALERRQHFRGPEGHVELPADAAALDLRVAQALAEHPDNGELRAVVVLEATPRRVVAALQSGQTITVSGAGLRPVGSGLAEQAPPNRRIRRGSVLRAVQLADGAWTLTQLPQVEAAFVALDPRTGEVRAMVGGFDFRRSAFNRVTQGWRQPGSAFKPFIFSAAFEHGVMPGTLVNDAPLFFDAATTGSQPWAPRNYDGEFQGPMSVRTAMARSRNLPAIRLLQTVGPQTTQDWLARFGFDTARHPPFLTMALGAGSVTPMQMASAYAVFANGGHLLAPTLISRVSDAEGRVLFQALPPVLDDRTRTLDPRNAFLMTELLREVTRSGTGARAQATLQRPDLYGKTGTTNDALDAWFAGWQPTRLAVAWVGHDNPRPLGSRETGGGLALPIWIDYMTHALKGVPVQEHTAPEGVARAEGDWAYAEFAGGNGIRAIGLEDGVPQAPTEEERSGILNLFRR